MALINTGKMPNQLPALPANTELSDNDVFVVQLASDNKVYQAGLTDITQGVFNSLEEYDSDSDARNAGLQNSTAAKKTFYIASDGSVHGQSRSVRILKA